MRLVRVLRSVVLVVSASVFAFVQPVQACTSFLLRTSDGGVVYGRTMEFGFHLDSDAIVVPRLFPFTGTGPGGKPGVTWKAKYGAVGLNANGGSILVDGMNEKGLAGGILYFPDNAVYTDPAKTDAATALAPWEFLTWVLTNFATVAEVKAAANAVTIINVVEPGLGIVPPYHYTVHDATGASIVIEPVSGGIKVYDNPFGVLTNSPSFDWHLTNLRNYVKISPVNAPPVVVDGAMVTPFGQGSGLIGIPGDPTPPSRFIRALGYVISAKKVPSGDASVRLAEHILNDFDIPLGFIRPGGRTNAPLEFTQWSTIADLTTKHYYVKTYEDQVLRGVDLMSFDLTVKTIVSAHLKSNPAPARLEFGKP